MSSEVKVRTWCIRNDHVPIKFMEEDGEDKMEGNRSDDGDSSSSDSESELEGRVKELEDTVRLT